MEQKNNKMVEQYPFVTLVTRFRNHICHAAHLAVRRSEVKGKNCMDIMATDEIYA